jgi:hypothetical protein
MQVQLARIICFGGQGLGLLYFAVLQNIGKVAVEPVDQFGRRRIVQANHQIVFYESVRMEVSDKNS